jgi:hypothetical protein
MLQIDVKVGKTFARRVRFKNLVELPAYHWFKVNFI